MKTFTTLILAAAINNMVAADEVASPSPLPSNTSTASILANRICTSDGPKLWYYNSKSEGPYFCTKQHDSYEWNMLNAYRSGGTQGVHWKYTNDPNDYECLTNWNYYSSDGKTLLTTVARITSYGDSKTWCALPVYRPGGVQGKQWQYCICCFQGVDC